jgi:hypothetical protein
MASEQQRLPTRERRPSTSAPIVDIQGAVGPAGISRPKHTRTATGFGPSEIKSFEGMLPMHSICSSFRIELVSLSYFWNVKILCLMHFPYRTIVNDLLANVDLHHQQPRFPNLSVKHGSATSLVALLAKTASRKRLSATSRPLLPALSSTAMNMLPTLLPVWLSVIA